MKKTAAALFGAILTVTLLAGTAQAGFGTGIIVGMVLSSSNNVVGSGDSNVLYVLPQVNERVKDPLKMKIAATYLKSFAPGSSDTNKSLEDLFRETISGADRYAILQVIRVLKPQNLQEAVIWFVYIEKELVALLEKPPQAKK